MTANKTANPSEIEILSLESKAKMKRTKVRIDELKMDRERHCHRPDEALQAESLNSLMESLISEGLQVPVEFHRLPDGTAELVKGHRRVMACRILASTNQPGFTLDMEIEAIEIEGASRADLLIRSISDNEVRLSLDRMDRIRVAKKLHDERIPTARAARAMGVSVKTYERDLLIARFPWMFQHVVDGSVSPTHAFLLLEAADKEGRLTEMREDIDAWIAAMKHKIREKEKDRKARGGKELSAGDKQVKKYLQNHLVTHWLELLRGKNRFDDDAKWNFDAGIETETEKLHISSVSLDLNKAPLDRLAKVAGRLSLLTKQMAPYLKKAYEKESGEVEPDTIETAYDLDYLRELGLEEFVSELEAETRSASEPDGEESPQEQPDVREEEDLTEEVELPPPVIDSTTEQKAKEPPAQSPKNALASKKGAK